MNPHRQTIVQLGQALGPAVLTTVQDLYRAEQDALAIGVAKIADAAYGIDSRQRLDIYVPEVDRPAPVLLWVHGGGFVRGEKASPDHPYNAHVGRWAAHRGMLGAVMNYRLAPEHGWPAGGEDVGAAIVWLSEHASQWGGDPSRIVVAGTSAGAVHVATYLSLYAVSPKVAGVVLLSGLYGFTPLDERDTLYYGAPELYPARAPREAVVSTEVPLLVACAEFDPPRFQMETMGLLLARLERHGRLPQSFVASGHNHFSLACHIGSADTFVADTIQGFIDNLPCPKEIA